MIVPACHGSAVAVSAKSQTCRECPHTRPCLRAAARVLLQLPDDKSVTDARKHLALTGRALLQSPLTEGEGQGARAPLNARESALVASLPKRVASQVRTMLETGWCDFARVELHRGRNPADKGWRRVYCAQLLAGGATRESLRMAFIQELGLSPASAKVQLCNALAIFAAGEIACEVGGQLRLMSKPVDRP